MDFSSPLAIARFLLPKVPFLIGTTAWYYLYLSPTSTKWDLKTELAVRLIRSLMETRNPKPLLQQQRATQKDPGIKGRMWVSKVTLPAPEGSDVLDLLCDAVDDMKETGKEVYRRPLLVPVEAEWVGDRANVDGRRPRLDLTEEGHFKRLMAETEDDTTILYLHGGALILMDPCTHRLPCANLARRTKGRCFSVRYRLAPQNAFPSALLDVLVAYLSLIYPPPSAYHKPVPANHIVFSGDSAGGTLSMALIQLLLHINRMTSRGVGSSLKSIQFHNHSISLPLPLPAGAATNSAWLDLTHSSPSVTENYQFDYLPRPFKSDDFVKFPKDEIWPTDPPRGDLYCETSMMCHPLASPIAASSWEGSCPLFLWYGQEMLADENKALASSAARQGVPVISQQWETMPHAASMIFPDSPMGKITFSRWAEFILQAVKGEKIQTKGSWFEAKTSKESETDVRNLATLSDEEWKRRMDDARAKRDMGLENETKLKPKL